jgi:hypothetical protein
LWLAACGLALGYLRGRQVTCCLVKLFTTRNRIRRPATNNLTPDPCRTSFASRRFIAEIRAQVWSSLFLVKDLDSIGGLLHRRSTLDPRSNGHCPAVCPSRVGCWIRAQVYSQGTINKNPTCTSISMIIQKLYPIIFLSLER